MKKMLAAFFAAFPVAWAYSASVLPTTNMTWLPMGSTNAMIAQLEKEVVEITPFVTFYTNSSVTSWGGWTNYTPSMGPLADVIRVSTTNTFLANLRPSDSGKTCWLVPGLQCSAEVRGGSYQGTTLVAPSLMRPFTVGFNPDGTPQVPPSLFDWPYVYSVPVSGALRGVKQVEYLAFDSGGNLVLQQTGTNQWSWVRSGTSRNGLMGFLPAPGEETNGVLYLTYSYIEPDWFLTNGYHGEVRLFYEFNPNVGDWLPYPYNLHPSEMYDGFDTLTGNKVHACGVKLYMSMTNGLPLVTAVSSPGTLVEIQTSMDMQNWSAVSQVLVGPDATAKFFPAGGPATQSFVVPGQSLFVRGRRTYP